MSSPPPHNGSAQKKGAMGFFGKLLGLSGGDNGVATPARLDLRSPPGLILKKGEECYSAAEGALMEDKVTRTKVRGGSVGMSARVTRGITLRASRFSADAVPETKLVPVSIGMFFVTNMRVIFRGNAKSFTVFLDKILNIEMFADATRITTDSGGKPRIVKFIDDSSVQQVRDVLAALFSADSEE